jgi:metal-responsive CopG/Arc/MetJ family transcriptional regulator
MKTTVDLPETLLREAKAVAARQGRTLRDFVAEAMNEKLHLHTPEDKPWMKHFGALSKLRKENRRIEKLIEAEFETVDPKEWR